MALQDLATNLNAALSQVYAPKVIRAFNRMSVLAAALPKTAGRGKNVAWEVYASGNSAAVYTDGADVSTYDVDTPLAATLSWGLYRQSFSISGLAQAAAATSTGSADELVNLIDTSAANSAMKLISVVNADLFTGSSGIVGLSTALAATGTYANIAKGTYSEWAGNVLSNGAVARNLTKDLMDQLEAAIYTNSSLVPGIIVASPGVVRKYESLFDQMNRVILATGEVSAIQRAPSSGGASVITDSVGWTGLTYKGIPVYRDRNCPTGTMYMLNPDMIQLQYLPQPGVNTAAIAQDKALQGVPNTNMAGLAARLEAMAKTGDADKFTMKLYLQLAVLRPNCHGFISDISET